MGLERPVTRPAETNVCIRQAGPPGFSLVESLVAVSVTSVVCTAVMLSMGRSVADNTDVVNRTVAVELARDLMEEIATRRFLDPDPGAGFGLEADEVTRPQVRTTFDDLDDYDGWQASPPQGVDGTGLGRNLSGGETDSFEDYRRAVVVAYVANGNHRKAVAAGRSDFVRVTVTVAYKGSQVYELQKLFSYDEQY